jgi:hypothetical protein
VTIRQPWRPFHSLAENLLTAFCEVLGNRFSAIQRVLFCYLSYPIGMGANL